MKSMAKLADFPTGEFSRYEIWRIGNRYSLHYISPRHAEWATCPRRYISKATALALEDIRDDAQMDHILYAH